MPYRRSISIAFAQPAATPGQNGRTNPLDRRRGSPRRAHGALMALPGRIDPHQLRAEMPVLWGQFLRRKFRRIEDVSVHFGVTFQCACNWWGGLHRPQGDAVLLACECWGAEFVEFMRGRV